MNNNEMNLLAGSERIDGYLAAVRAIKDDGTDFHCVYLGEGPPTGKTGDVAEKFGLSPQNISLLPSSVPVAASGLPAPVEAWLLKRIRPFDSDAQVDLRLASGLFKELIDLFDNRAPLWFDVNHLTVEMPAYHLGAFWSIYVFGREKCSFALLCSWDD